MDSSGPYALFYIVAKSVENQWSAKMIAIDLLSWSYTDRNILDDSHQLVKHFSDFPLWEYRFASFDKKLLLKGSNTVLPEWEIREMFF